MKLSFHFRTTGIFALMIMLQSQMTGQEDQDLWKAENFSGLKMRSIGPAFMSGRIADIAIHPNDESTWYVAVGSGGVWKTTNSGVSWQTVFDDQESYSTGCVTIDPNNPATIWLGTGENVGGRHVGYGDGVYRSTDGGKKWQHLGLKKSEHISKIIVHPENPNIVWVAAQGPLWSKGGERGVYKTTDAGKNWKRTLGDEEWTGATDLLIDPRNPERLYAATWQRHRTVAAYLGGGPETGIYRSEDGGETWQELKEGLPESNMGKIGLALSPQNPDVVYAAIELDHRTGGVYKSRNRGSTWTKQSDAVSGGTGPHYYQELYTSPHHDERLYLMDVRIQVSEDGGATFRRMEENYKHSDNHALAFKKSDPNYLLAGTDGGLYESYDLGKNWRFISNMPITQFYKIAVDDARPFYNIYGGTQDNSTQGGPSRTANVHGIQNSDWKVILYADGHQPATEPGNPEIVYAQWQQGSLTRIDMATGEVVYIQPQPDVGEKQERYNWDAPIFVSPHKHSRVYFGSQRLWRSENRGDSWKAVSGDLTRDQERIEMPIMGKQQGWDNPWDLYAMSTYNTITSISESPLREDLIYIGTDDGLLQITDNGGESWRKIEVGSLPGAPGTAYVNDIKADLHDSDAVYVALDNHKYGDFKPYLYKSTNRGRTWESLAGDLPERHLVWRLVQDHINKQLLFAGTEFGIFFSVDGGEKWTELKGGLPSISFRDLAIQRRENDLVAASFGRSLYVFDDIGVFRELSEDALEEEGKLFPTRDTWWYVPRAQLSFGDKKGSQGEAHFVADNPPFGAVFTYHLKEGYPSLKSQRQEHEKKLKEQGATIPFPGWQSVAEEEQEEGVKILLVVSDSTGKVIRKITGPTEKGFHRVNWDLKYPSPRVVSLGQDKTKGEGLFAPPGEYFVELQKVEKGRLSTLSEKRSFKVVPLYEGSLENPLGDEREEFWREYEDLLREYTAFTQNLQKTGKKIEAVRLAYEQSSLRDEDLVERISALRDSMIGLENDVLGNIAKRKIGEKTKPTLSDRVSMLGRVLSHSTYGPTPAAIASNTIAEDLLWTYQNKLNKYETTLKELAEEIQQAGGPIIEGF